MYLTRCGRNGVAQGSPNDSLGKAVSSTGPEGLRVRPENTLWWAALTPGGTRDPSTAVEFYSSVFQIQCDLLSFLGIFKFSSNFVRETERTGGPMAMMAKYGCKNASAAE